MTVVYSPKSTSNSQKNNIDTTIRFEKLRTKLNLVNEEKPK